MKRLLLLLLAMTACHAPQRQAHRNAWMERSGHLKVLTSIAMIADVAEQIGGENVDVLALIEGELDPHSYELVKGDDEKFRRADLIFYNGLGLEHGLSLRKALENNPKAVALGNTLLERTPSPILLSDGQYDPHIWMDIALWKQVVDPIVEALSARDPEHASTYRERGEALTQRLNETDAKIYDLLHSVPEERRYLVTSHDAFSYFTRHYLAEPEEVATESWQVRCAAPEGLAPDAQLSVTDIMEILDHVETYKIPVLFPESNVSRDALRKIEVSAQERGFDVRLSKETLYGDSMGTATYLEMIAHNAEVIARELKEGL